MLLNDLSAAGTKAFIWEMVQAQDSAHYLVEPTKPTTLAKKATEFALSDSLAVLAFRTFAPISSSAFAPCTTPLIA